MKYICAIMRRYHCRMSGWYEVVEIDTQFKIFFHKEESA